MTKAIAVIGANYGDEGKGATVHRLAKLYNISDVVRFNGGSQAGHTVQIQGGVKHIFHTYGSSTLQGATTWYTEDMMVSPIHIFEEWESLSSKISKLSLIKVHPECVVVTPWDIALNQMMELGRGADRHGSCGQGINEAMTRHLHPDNVRLTAEALLNDVFINGFIPRVTEWYHKRVLEEIEKGTFSKVEDPNFIPYLTSSELRAKALMKFLQYPPAFLRACMVAQVEKKGRNYPIGLPTDEGRILFEGAQGLLLDQEDVEHFPHVTRSSTGLKNVLKACVNGVELEQVYYVTRPFLTRHGQGPILKGLPCGDLWDQGQDKTNRFNQFQGGLRYSHLDWGMLKDRIEKDVAQCPTRPKVKLALTWMDSIHNQEKYQFYWHGEVTEFDSTDSEKIQDTIHDRLGIEVVSFDGRKG
jgi:adenylosuccinate synthase